ncbi:unnamed protein product [Didymodactylos carnosus]|uniref:Uncharacterized protein n=1 Tax=Didymodactylos carnosus TaxID=1234261 RepID=A0A815ZED1_9BILA|nr:unnamed protein product [Didymodactylos carnosus]CAF4451184.1 unnamed protein product [Didymodactylos carnosus]
MIHDENQYLLVHQQLLTQPTTNEHARASRIVSQMDHNHPTSSTDPLIQLTILQTQKRKNLSSPLIIHYTHEQRFAYYKVKIHQIWNNLFLHTHQCWTTN